MKIDQLPAKKLLFEVEQRNGCHTIDARQYLRYAGIPSITDISEIDTSSYFPPEKYSNTGRTPSMPSDYMCMGSLSWKFALHNGERRALSLALFHDTTKHRGTSEVNAWIYGWPVGIASPDHTREVPCHSLRDNAPIKITIARGTRIEKRVCVTTPV